MSGGKDFRTSLKERLDYLQPSRQQIESFVNQKPCTLTPGISALVAALQGSGRSVYLVSGGFLSLIAPVADTLGIPRNNIFCNRIKFYYDGAYAGFDEEAPTSKSHGKAEVVRLIKETRPGDNVLVMVGDGATDMEACPPADAFIGFGGNVERESVRQGATVYVKDFSELLSRLS